MELEESLRIQLCEAEVLLLADLGKAISPPFIFSSPFFFPSF